MKLEILEMSYMEHFKYVKDMTYILTPDHPKIIKMNIEINKMLIEINSLKKDREEKNKI